MNAKVPIIVREIIDKKKLTFTIIILQFHESIQFIGNKIRVYYSDSGANIKFGL